MRKSLRRHSSGKVLVARKIWVLGISKCSHSRGGRDTQRVRLEGQQVLEGAGLQVWGRGPPAFRSPPSPAQASLAPAHFHLQAHP